ncbi:hypothetical protein [Oleiphilus sp. HI0066]|nr:hypothetical protein [Oleiphilus sp. HI0066]KZY73209.1 hypothetical protein A3739_15400 [Oleiphilus sp. HI0067]
MFAFLVFAMLLSSAKATELELDDEDLLVVQLSVGPYTDDEPIFIYRSPEQTLLPVDTIASLLEIAIESDIDELLVSGWVGDESNTFELDLTKQEYYSKGVAQPWPQTIRYAEDGFDVYLDQQILQDLFGFNFDIDVSQLQLRVDASKDIPLIAKLERKKRQEEIERPELETLPETYIPNTYEWWNMPHFDISIGADVEKNRGASDFRHDLVVQGRADVAKHSLQASLISNNSDTDIRLTFSRASEGPDKTIALGMDRYEVGDVTGLSDALLFSSVQGSGARLSRGGESIQEQGDVITLEGDAPPGWEVELYRNGSLIEFSETTSQGRYIFENVPIYLGENIFDIRLYGPQGQEREIREVVSSGGAMLKAGAWEYDIWSLQRNQRLVGGKINDFNEVTNFNMAEVRYGLHRSLTARLGLSAMTPNSTSTDRQYFHTSLYGSLGQALSQFDYAKDLDGGSAYQLTLQSRLLDTSLNASASKFSDLISDRNQNGKLDSEYALRLDRSFLVGLPSALSVDLEFRDRSFVDGDGNFTTNLRKATGWAGYQFVNELLYFKSSGSSDISRTDGGFSATRRWEGWRYKGSIAYSVAPSSSVNSLSFSASHKFASNINYTGSVAYNFTGKDLFSNDNTLTWEFEKFSVSGSAGFNTDGFAYLGATLSTSVGYDAKRDSHFLSNESSVNSASLNARVFIDENDNQMFDEGEETLPGIRFKGKSKWRTFETGDDGVVVLKGIDHLQMEKIEIEEKSIEDPFIKAASGPFFVYTHAGSVLQQDIPLAYTFEVEGSLFVKQNGQQRPLSTVRVEVLNEAGDQVALTRSEYDGVYLLSGLLPGKYCVSVNENDLADRDLKTIEPTCFYSDGKDGVVFIEDIVF